MNKIKNKPIFYPSVSSIAKNKLTALEHIEILIALKYPYFLISTYDIYNFNQEEKEKFELIKKKITDNKINLIVDSGIYEKVWKQDETWTLENYHKSIDSLPYNFVFNYDEYINPIDEPLDRIIESIKKSDIVDLVPILHAKNIEDLPQLCFEIAQLDTVKTIAIPERELGNGMIEGIHTIIQIREKLSKLENYTKIHLLGTGNPLSLLLYSAFGVDSFDGLDWCQMVVNHEDGLLHHSLQLDFFSYQSKYTNMYELSYITRLFAHNLEFYSNWMNDINQELEQGTIEDMLKYYLPKSILTKILQMYGEYRERTNK